MSDSVDNTDNGGPLTGVVRLVRDAAADRSDAAAELQEFRRIRLELLAEELKPVFSDVPADDPQFDFVLSSGLQPRLWIDATAHISMGRDARTYRFLRDSRMGRTVIAESSNLTEIANSVTRHIAERVVERQRMLDGPVSDPIGHRRRGASGPETGKRPLAMFGEYLSGLLLVLFGAIAGLAILYIFITDLFPGLTN